jgi:hypothetical protein
MRARWSRQLTGAIGAAGLAVVTAVGSGVGSAAGAPVDDARGAVDRSLTGSAKADDDNDTGGKTGGKSGEKADEKAPTKEKPPKPDTDPPLPPSVLGTTVQAAGAVSLSIAAEAKAEVIIAEGIEVVARVVATGSSQSVTWTATHGSHSYELMATDEAGNESETSVATVEVDAKAPRVREFVVEPGTTTDTRSVVAMATEKGASYRLVVDGSTVEEGTAQGRVRKVLDLADGTHAVDLLLSDETGNERTASRELVVDIPRLLVDAEVVSESTQHKQTVTVQATPNATATLQIPGRRPAKIALVKGRGEVTLSLPDGTYEAPRVVVVDSQGRQGTGRLADITVDTSGPQVSLTTDSALADLGRLGFSLQAEPGDAVSWRIINPDQVIAAAGQLVAGESAHAVERDVEEGRYTVEVRVTDAFGRATDAERSVTVAADPATTGEKAMLAGGVAAPVVILAALLVVLVRRRRRRRPAVEIDPSPVEPRTARRRRLLGSRSGATDLVTYRAEEAEWRDRRDALTALRAAACEVLTAGLGGPSSTAPEVTLLHASARLLEGEVGAQGRSFTEIDEGEIVITDRRVTFQGDLRREWVFDPLDRFRHVSHDRTVVRGAFDDGWWGLVYAEPEITRLAIDFAVTSRSEARRLFVAALDQSLRQHDLRRPTPPADDPASGAQASEREPSAAV